MELDITVDEPARAQRRRSSRALQQSCQMRMGSASFQCALILAYVVQDYFTRLSAPASLTHAPPISGMR